MIFGVCGLSDAENLKLRKRVQIYFEYKSILNAFALVSILSRTFFTSLPP